MPSRCAQCGTELPMGVPAWVRELTVGHVMTRDPITIDAEDSLAHAVELTRSRNIRHLPVVVGDSLVGILAEGDLKRAQPSALSDSQEEFDRVMAETPVSRIMISDPLTVTEVTPLLEAAQTLHSTRFGALPVLREGRLVGILTDVDLLGCLVDLVRFGG